MSKDMVYYSTRGGDGPYTASQAILKGLAGDGGLFVPGWIPSFEDSLEDMSRMGYRELAFSIMRQFLTDFTDEELKDCIAGAYDDKFDTEEIVPLSRVGNTTYLELYHGPTIAFKDMALSILPYFMSAAAKKNGSDQEIVILTATSGDTGKAALAGFADVPGTRIQVFYPVDGVSEIQKLQMVTQKGDNTCVTAIRGNFDDAQTGVKKLFANEELVKAAEEKGYRFSSANSINIGRLVPQIVYYVYAYTRLVAEEIIPVGQEVDVTVPTGNFGNILACWIAKEMGLPVRHLICASNENHVLTDFFAQGVYDRNRPFLLTTSPSMDILVSSNLERLLYWMCAGDAVQTKAFMDGLSGKGRYEIPCVMKDRMKEFLAGYATEDEVKATIGKVLSDCGYCIDPHTAVAATVANRFAEADVPMLVASTASPYKFPAVILEAAGDAKDTEDFKILTDALNKVSGMPIPQAVTDLYEAEVRHTGVCAPDEMEAAVRAFLGL